MPLRVTIFFFFLLFCTPTGKWQHLEGKWQGVPRSLEAGQAGFVRLFPLLSFCSACRAVFGRAEGLWALQDWKSPHEPVPLLGILAPKQCSCGVTRTLVGAQPPTHPSLKPPPQAVPGRPMAPQRRPGPAKVVAALQRALQLQHSVTAG